MHLLFDIVSLIKRYSKIINRLYIEVFTYNQYYYSKSIGYRNVICNNITAITIGANIFYSNKSQLMKLYKRNVEIYAYLIQNVTDIKLSYFKYIT